jgi:hypothetical protein
LIVLDLQCAQGHNFEGWFASAMAFEHQLTRELINCPHCGGNDVARRPSAPYVHVRSATAPAKAIHPAEPDTQEAVAANLRAKLRQEARGLEDVGQRFPEEARRIHYGDAQSRGIRGQASGQEFQDLLAEGILVLPVPSEEDVH